MQEHQALQMLRQATAGGDLHTVDDGAVQSSPQTQSSSTVHEKPVYTGQVSDRQMQMVCFYLDQPSLSTVNFSLMHINT